MARSGLRSKWPWRCLPMLCLTWLVVSHALSCLSFVRGVSWGAGRQVMARSSQRRRELPKVPGDDARSLSCARTKQIKDSQSARELLGVLDDMLFGTFDFYQVSASYQSLVKWKKSRGRSQKLQASDWEGPVVARLHARVEDMVQEGELDAQATANVLWSIAKFSAWPSIPRELVVALAESLPAEAESMNPQDLSNCLWASAHIKDVAPDVLQLVPAISAKIPGKAKDMVPQALSNSLWASAQLKDVAPDVLQVVPAVVAQIPDEAKDMTPQELSNCLWAALQLKDDAPKVLEIVPVIVTEAQSKIKDMNAQQLSNMLEAIVPLHKSFPEVTRLVADVDSEEDTIRSAAARLNILFPRLKGKDLVFAVPVIVWATAKFGMHNKQLMNSVAQSFMSNAKMSSLPDFGACALAWSYQELGTQDAYTDFQELLGLEVAGRGFSRADVESCKLGRSEWNGEKGR